MRGGMPTPPRVSAGSVLALPGPLRRSRSARLSPLVITALTVALAGAATGYRASQGKQVSVAELVSSAPAVTLAASPLRAPTLRAFQVPKPVQTDDSLSRALSDPVAGRLAVGVRKPMPLTVYADGKVLVLRSRARTVSDVLKDLRIRVGASDRVVPAAQTPVWSGAKLRVVRMQREIAARAVTLPAPTIHRLDPTLPRGRIAVTPGRSGLKMQRFLQVFADDRMVSRSFLDQQVVRPSQPRVIRTGTKILVASRGAYAGHEFMEMVSTAYAPYCCRGVDSQTAIGLRAGYGVVAVDPRIIPLRSILWIEGYGRAVAGDTGSAIKGLRIDLGMDTTRLARQWGRRAVRVYIIQKAPPRKPRP